VLFKAMGSKCDLLFGVEVYKSVYNIIWSPGVPLATPAEGVTMTV
jgi:hypothetical protein